jgi:methyl-accepting chemotaxis protein
MKEAIEKLEKERKEIVEALEKSKDRLDDSLDSLSRTDDEVDKLKEQKNNLLNQIGSITNGTHPIEMENKLRQIQEENNHLKQLIETNLKYIETALSTTRESLEIYGTTKSNISEANYTINDQDYLEAEKEISQVSFSKSKNGNKNR